MEHVPDVAETLPECPVCLYVFEQPRILPACGHTLCGKCVAPLVMRTNNLATAKCPLCKVVSTMPQAGFPVNYALRAALSVLGERKACTACRKFVAADDMIRCRTCEMAVTEYEVTVCAECFLNQHKEHIVAKPISSQQRFDEALCAASNVENEFCERLRQWKQQFAQLESFGNEYNKVLMSVVAGCNLLKTSAQRNANAAALDSAKIHEFSVHVQRMHSLRAILLDESTNKFWAEAEELRQRVASIRHEPLPELVDRNCFSKRKPFDALREACQLISQLSFNPTNARVGHSAEAVSSTSAESSSGVADVSRTATAISNTAMDHQVAESNNGGVLRPQRNASTSTFSEADTNDAFNITPIVFFCRLCGRGDHWTRHCGNRRRYCTTCRRVHSAQDSCRATATPRP